MLARRDEGELCMSRKFLLGMMIALLITNISTLLLWKQANYVVVNDHESIKVNKHEQVASVGKINITYEEWLHSLMQQYGESHLKKMINHEAVGQLAKKKGIEVSNKVIEREMAYLITMQGPLLESELKQMKEMWREDLLYRFQLETLLTENVKVSEEEMKAYYDEYHKQYDFEGSVQLSQIIVEHVEKAEQIMKELKAGASFDLLASEYSIDEETRSKGGYLGFFTERNQLLPSSYFDVFSSMEAGSYSEPIVVHEGVAILYLHQYLPSITFTYEEARPYIRNELGINKVNEHITAETLWDGLDVNWVYEE